MSWKSNPKIRDLEPYSKRHGYAYVVVFGVRQGGETFDVTTYGRTAKLCKLAGIAGDQLAGLVNASYWPDLPDWEPQP